MPDTADHYAPNPAILQSGMTAPEIESALRACNRLLSAKPKKPSNSKAAQIERALHLLQSAGYSVTMPVPPVHKPVVAYKLAGLKADRWAYVARKVPQGEYDVWAWSLSVAERNRLNQMASEGAIITSQRKGPDGVVRLMARLRAGA